MFWIGLTASLMAASGYGWTVLRARGRYQTAQPEQVIGYRCQPGCQLCSCHPSEPAALKTAILFEPTEDRLDATTHYLADLIALAIARPSVDGRVLPLAGYMGRHVQLPAASDELCRVVSLVSSNRLTPPSAEPL